MVNLQQLKNKTDHLATEVTNLQQPKNKSDHLATEETILQQVEGTILQQRHYVMQMGQPATTAVSHFFVVLVSSGIILFST